MVGFAVVLIPLNAWYMGDWRWLILGAALYAMGWMFAAWFGHLFMPDWANRLVDDYWKWWDNQRRK